MSKEIAEDIARQINALFKKDVLTTGSDEAYQTSYIPTGMLPIDILLEGGIPKGRFTTLYGDFSSGKTLIGLYAIRQCQRQGGVAALVDTEHAYSESWAKLIGVDTEALLVLDYSNETGEAALSAAEALIRTRQVDLIVFDSISATVPAKEHDSALDDAQPALLARLMSKAMRKLTTANRNTAVLWISQVRTNLGITFGSKETISGGKATGFYSSYMIRMVKRGKATRDVQVYTGDKWETSKETTKQGYQAELTKSKLTKPHKQIFFSWDLEENNIDMMGFMIAQGLELGLIGKGGAWWTYDIVNAETGEVTSQIKSQGQEKFREALTSTEGALKDLTDKIAANYGLDNIYYEVLTK